MIRRPGGLRMQRQPPPGFFQSCRRWGVRPTRWLLWVRVDEQSMWLFRGDPGGAASPGPWRYRAIQRYRISTARLGVGQRAGANRTPLGLHRVLDKIGAGWPIGTVFRSRRVVGCTWQGMPHGPIAHRILWLDGLEPGWNRGGRVDTHSRYIYIHGTGDEPTLGRPASKGCVHVAAADLMPLFDRLPSGSLVWISAGPNR